MNSTAETELVERAKAGDIPAFEALFRQYNARIYNFAKQVTGSAEDAGDAVQETFIRAWHSLPDLRSVETFGVWLHRIALNYCRDIVKRRGRRFAVSLDTPIDGDDGEPLAIDIESDDPGPEESLISAETQRAIRRALSSLSSDHRLVVTMHHLEGMDVQSIAGILGISKGTVMSRLSRARDVLRRKLIPYVEGDQR
jgi:RNA polymerase sigma-70 factor (ECF subfamily)